MKNLLRLTAIFVILSFALSGCYYDKENELYPDAGNCDTATVGYAKSIAPIMVAHCNVCHSTRVASGSVVTDTHDGLYIVAEKGTL